jgi:hypothetical protein
VDRVDNLDEALEVDGDEIGSRTAARALGRLDVQLEALGVEQLDEAAAQLHDGLGAEPVVLACAKGQHGEDERVCTHEAPAI